MINPADDDAAARPPAPMDPLVAFPRPWRVGVDPFGTTRPGDPGDEPNLFLLCADGYAIFAITKHAWDHMNLARRAVGQFVVDLVNGAAAPAGAGEDGP